MRISSEAAQRKVLAGCASAPAKLKTASSIKAPPSNPMGEAMNSSCWPMTSLTSHTKERASATSRKVGFEADGEGQAGNGMKDHAA